MNTCSRCHNQVFQVTGPSLDPVPHFEGPGLVVEDGRLRAPRGDEPRYRMHECGAFRPLHQIPPNGCTPVGPWRVPTGIGGENPADRSIRAQRAYDERARRKAMRS